MDIADSLKDEVLARYGGGAEEISVVRAPYRICPLGAHVDHQLGRVSGMALDRSVLLAFRPSSSRRMRLRSRNFEGEVSFDIGSAVPGEKGSWGAYVWGAALALLGRHRLERGIEGVIEGSLPAGGVSSSAAVGVAYLLALERANGLALGPQENIELDRTIENVYVGLQNGILDPSVILLSQRDELLHLDTMTREHESVPLGGDPASLRILVVRSGVTRALVSTDYNRHVEECREAAAMLLVEGGLPVPDAPVLGLVPREVFEAHGDSLPAGLALRARHFFEETARVLEGVEAWRAGDLRRFGDLMNRSCESSIRNYRCGCPELIRLFEILSGLDGVFGCRFSGAGYGGCSIAFIDPSAENRISARVREAYLAAFPERAEGFAVVSCRPADGARVL